MISDRRFKYIRQLAFCASFLACENIPFSSLFVDGDVSRGGTSATQRQKFHIDETKRNFPGGEERGETDVFAGYQFPDTKVLNTTGADTINAFFLHVLYCTELLIRISRIRLTKVLLNSLKREICIKRRPKFYPPQMFTDGQCKGWQKFTQLSETRINHCKFQMSIFWKKL